jgi:3-polyprenyl-4-hydroxybenzoate decarboxylase
MSVAPAKIETLRKVATMLKAIAIAKATKVVIREVKKFDVNVAMDKGTSKLILTIQRKK